MPELDFMGLIQQGLGGGIDAFRDQQAQEAQIMLKLLAQQQQQAQFGQEQRLAGEKFAETKRATAVEEKGRAGERASQAKLRDAQIAEGESRTGKRAGRLTRKDHLQYIDNRFNQLLELEQDALPRDPFGNPVGSIPPERIKALRHQARQEARAELFPRAEKRVKAKKQEIRQRVMGSLPGAGGTPAGTPAAGGRFKTSDMPPDQAAIFDDLPELEPGEKTVSTFVGPISKQQMVIALQKGGITGNIEINHPELKAVFEHYFRGAGR